MARVMVVEDEADTRQLLDAYLRLQGHDVIQASNGWEALIELGRGKGPDLIVLDALMPGLDGPKFLAIAQRASTAMTAPVIVVSALARDELAKRFRGLDVSELLTKGPGFFDQLVQSVNFHLA